MLSCATRATFFLLFIIIVIKVSSQSYESLPEEKPPASVF